jgi:general secretion pathway protein D
LTADEGTNTLIAMAEPRVLAQVESLLKTLDVRQPQVMLEVMMVSLTDAQTLDLGVELDKLITVADTKIRLSSLFGLSNRGSNGEPGFGVGSGFTGTVLDPGDFSAVVRALQTINKGRSLSMPKLLVTNNQQATIDSTLDQPYASTNASNTVTTTSYGGSQQAGTQVTLKPQISQGDQLLLDYSVSLSAFVGASASANLPPPRQQNKVQSSASLPDGYTVVVGGIDLSSEGKGTSQVPGIGDIPILGEAFKSRKNTASHSRFYVFIRANVMRSQGFEDLKYASDVASRASGVDDGWPELEPRVIR